MHNTLDALDACPLRFGSHVMRDVGSWPIASFAAAQQLCRFRSEADIQRAAPDNWPSGTHLTGSSRSRWPIKAAAAALAVLALPSAAFGLLGPALGVIEYRGGSRPSNNKKLP
jgi:hypothetical protein